MEYMVIWGVLLGMILAILFAVWPCRLTAEQKNYFQNRNYAHRGLHTRDGALPENSLPAFHAAVAAGYGIELDLQLTKDGQVVVFHDDTLRRVCGAEGAVRDYTLEELRGFSLMNSVYKIPLFTDVLREVNCVVPLIIELKTCPEAELLCQKAWAILLQYGGKFCIESFDPHIIRWWRVHARQVVRGQLTAPYRQLRQKNSGLVSFILANCLTNLSARPHFIAYSKKGLAPGGRLCLFLGGIPVVWTAHPEDDVAALQAKNAAVIFEYYTPHIRY